jgi:hypothetical protein
MALNWKMLVPLAAAAAVAVFLIVSPAIQNLSVEIATVVDPKEKEELANETNANKKQTPEPASVNLKVIRNSTSPVPVSNYKKKEQEKEELNEEKANTSGICPDRCFKLQTGKTNRYTSKSGSYKT